MRVPALQEVGDDGPGAASTWKCAHGAEMRRVLCSVCVAAAS